MSEEEKPVDPLSLIMGDDSIYRDVDGNTVHLNTLCRREPAWAANQIRRLREDQLRLVVQVRELLSACRNTKSATAKMIEAEAVLNDIAAKETT